MKAASTAGSFEPEVRVPGYRVLLVEDNAGDAELTTESLWEGSDSSIEVRTASTLAEARRHLASFVADAVILDLNLPDSRGIQTLRHVKGVARGEAIIVISGILDERLRRQALAEGAEEVFAKSEAAGRLFAHSVLYVIERNRARAQHRRLQTLLETTPDAILVVNTAGVVRYVNEAALSLFGRQREDFVGELVGFSVRDGEPIEVIILRRGRPRICEMQVVRFEWQGEPAFLGSIRDLTELKQSQREAIEKAKLADDRAALLQRMLNDIASLARRLGLADVARASGDLLDARSSDALSEEILTSALIPFEVAFRGYVEANAKLAEQNRELASAKASTEAANRELDAFSYSVAHDLRAPLRVIDGFCQALAEDCREQLSDDGQRHLERIREAAQRMSHLIDDLLHLAHVTRWELRQGTVNLSRLARIVLLELQLTEPARSVESSIEEGLVAECDEHLLRIAFTNLLGNAWKYTGKTERPHIQFGRTEIDGRPAYFIRDNGAGFDPAYSGKLFQVFQRLHSLSEFDGTGVGLTIVKRIIQRHGGRIWAESAVDRGATFYFTLSPETATE